MNLENGETCRICGVIYLVGSAADCHRPCHACDAPILILDEATAYTDPENEARIQSSLACLIEGRPLIAAHRLPMIMSADQIVPWS